MKHDKRNAKRHLNMEGSKNEPARECEPTKENKSADQKPKHIWKRAFQSHEEQLQTYSAYI